MIISLSIKSAKHAWNLEASNLQSAIREFKRELLAAKFWGEKFCHFKILKGTTISIFKAWLQKLRNVLDPEVQLDNEYLNHLKKLVLNKKIEWIKKAFIWFCLPVKLRKIEMGLPSFGFAAFFLEDSFCKYGKGFSYWQPRNP